MTEAVVVPAPAPVGEAPEQPRTLRTLVTAQVFSGAGLAASPERVARSVVRAISGGREVVYVPWFWRGIMLVIRAIPERVFKRLRL